MRILVVEDEKRIADFLCRGLQGAGYAVDAAPPAARRWSMIHATDYDLVILDLMLPDMDGLQVLERIRNRKRAAGADPQRARHARRSRQGLETRRRRLSHKAVRVRRIVGARAGAAAARPADARETAGGRSDARLHPPQSTRGGEAIELAPKEFGILEYMMRNRGRPLSRTMIVEHVWDMDYDGLTNIVDVYIRHLRSKIDDRFQQKLIQTVRGIGYMIEAPEKRAATAGGAGDGIGRCRMFRRGCDLRRVLARPAFTPHGGFGTIFRHLADRLRRGIPGTAGRRAQRPGARQAKEEWAAMKGYLRIDRVHGAEPERRQLVLRSRTTRTRRPPCSTSKKSISSPIRTATSSGRKGGRPAGVVDLRRHRHRKADVIRPASRCAARPTECVGAQEDPDGNRYLIRSGIVYDEGDSNRPHAVLRGDRHDPGRTTRRSPVHVGLRRRYPRCVILGCVLGWVMAGRALTPVMDIAQRGAAHLGIEPEPAHSDAAVRATSSIT